MPSWLSPTARVEWKRVVPQLCKLGVITKLDQAVLAGYCQAVAEYLESTRVLNVEGLLVEQIIYARDSGKAVGARKAQHPMVAIQRSAYAIMRRFASEFGLTPASRKKLKVNSQVAGDTNPIDELIARGRRAGDFVPRRRRTNEIDQLDEPGPYASTSASAAGDNDEN